MQGRGVAEFIPTASFTGFRWSSLSDAAGTLDHFPPHCAFGGNNNGRIIQRPLP